MTVTEQITISNGTISVTMPRVRAVEVGGTEVAKTAEMASGRMVKDVLGYRTTILAQWDWVPAATITSLLSLLRSGGFFQVSYPTPEGGETNTFEVDYPTVGIFAFMDGAPVWHGVTLWMQGQEVSG